MEVEDEHSYRTACGRASNSHQELGTVDLGSGGSPGRTVKKNAITGAVLGPKCFRTEFRTESGCPFIAVKQFACSSQLRLMHLLEITTMM